MIIPHDRIVLGQLAKTREPIEGSREELSQTHISVIGQTGSGKTDLLASLIKQLNSDYVEDGVVKRDVVGILDLEGSQPLFWTHQAATAHRENVNLFLDPALDGVTFNPLQLPEHEDDHLLVDVLMLATHLTEALGIASTLDYGVFYYYMVALISVVRAIESAEKTGRPLTWETLLTALENQGHDLADGRLVKHCIKMLRLFPQLCDTTAPAEKTLNMARVLKRLQSFFAFIPAVGGNSAARQIAALICGCLLMEMMSRKIVKRGPKVRVWLVIDGAGLAINTYAATFLTTARKFGISCILAAQHSTQYTTRDKDVLPLVRGNCRVQIFSTATEEEREYISGESLTRRVRYRGGVEDPLSLAPTQSWREMVEPSFGENLVKRISGTRQHAVLLWHQGGVFHNPRHIFIPFTCKTKEEYDSLDARPLPRRPAPPAAPKPTPGPGGWQAPVLDPARQARLAAFEAAHDALVARHLPAKKP